MVTLIEPIEKASLPSIDELPGLDDTLRQNAADIRKPRGHPG